MFLAKVNFIKLLNRFIFVAAFFTLFSSYSLACDCVKNSAVDAKKWLENSTGAIFAGKVVKIEETQIPLEIKPGLAHIRRQITFKVQKNWKNADSDEIVITTGYGGGDCGFRFIEGKEYLVDALKVSGKLQTNICTFTQEKSAAGKLIKKLDKAAGKTKSR